MRKCPFHNCGAEIPANLFACRRHWYSLSESERQRIWAAYRDWQDGRLGGEELREVQQQVLGDRGMA